MDIRSAIFWAGRTDAKCGALLDALLSGGSGAATAQTSVSDKCYYNGSNFRNLGGIHDPTDTTGDEACACAN